MQQACLDPIDDRTGNTIRLSGLLVPFGCGMELSHGEMGLPELCRVTDRLRQRQGLTQPALRFVPPSASESDLAPQPPAFDEILP